MNNIIQSDLYRIRKGAAMRNTLLAVLAVVLLNAIIFAVVNTGVFQSIIENEISTGAVSESERMSLEGDLIDINQAVDMLPQGGASFTGVLLSENALTLLVLIIAVVIMGADFDAGTFRNTLSYETDRKKVYLGKLAVNFILLLGLMEVYVLFSVIVGSIFFGFSGFSVEFFVNMLTVMLLQLPIYMALLSFAQCLLAFTQKSGATIAIYLLFILFFSGIVQIFAMLLPTIRWILRLDFISVVRLLANYQTAPPADIIVPLIVSLVVLVGTTVLGMVHYCRTDMH